jgi:hypothetical protein
MHIGGSPRPVEAINDQIANATVSASDHDINRSAAHHDGLKESRGGGRPHPFCTASCLQPRKERVKTCPCCTLHTATGRTPLLLTGDKMCKNEAGIWSRVRTWLDTKTIQVS